MMPPDPNAFTRRELEILDLLVKGGSNKQLAEHLGISLRTVEKHLEHILRKSGATNRTEAVVCWLRRQARSGDPSRYVNSRMDESSDNVQ